MCIQKLIQIPLGAITTDKDDSNSRLAYVIWYLHIPSIKMVHKNVYFTFVYL